MKLSDAAEFLKEVDDEDKKRPPAVSGPTVSTSQAASILGRVMSRIRQLISSGILKPVIKPRKGDRDHELLKKDVDNYKEKLQKGKVGKKGRPPKSDKKKRKK